MTWLDIALALGALLLAVASYSGGLLARDAVTAVRVWLTRRQLRAECLAYAQEQREIDQALAVAMAHADFTLWQHELDRSDR